MVEQEIAERLAAAKIRLRFDRVVVRIVGRLKAALADIVPQDQTVIFTLTAPIKLPAKTVVALEDLVRAGLPGGNFSGIVHGNMARIRRVTGVASAMPRVVGFVHNPDSDSDVILAVAGSRLLGRE